MNLGYNRITNIEHPRNPQENPAYDRDVVTAKYLFDYVQIADKKFLPKDEAEAFLTKEEAESFLQKEGDRKFLKANEDNVLDGRLDMKQHRIIGLSDPV